MNRVWGLDLVRATAVIGVLMSHLQGQTEVTFIQKALPIGPVFGVELFFVLSGFLIGQILIREFIDKKFSSSVALNFMKRRWYRTLPNYYLFFIIALFLQQQLTWVQIAPFTVFMQNILHKPIDGFYGVTWSLTIEEIFYVAFPVSLILLNKLNISKDAKILAAILAFIVLPFLLRATVYDSPEFIPADYRKAAVIRLDSIAFGVLMAYFKLRSSRVWSLLTIQGAWLLIPFWYFFVFNQVPSLKLADWALVYFPLCSATMALMLPFFDSLKTNKSILTKPVSFIADISYSLYLCHIPVIIVSNRFFAINSQISGHILELYYVISSIIVAFIVNRLWEKPMTNLRDRKPDKSVRD